MDKKFDHRQVEQGKYDSWLDQKLFDADVSSNKKPYSIILPPPNVTGKLHLGHAWDGTMQDILIRYHHLMGYETMWIAGMDHAGIATQAKVDQRLSEQNISRYDLGREKYLEKAWEWKDEYASHIRQQWAKLGFALDYSKEKFTLDQDVNTAVLNVFVKLYEKGLIYQGYRITNWDPKARTALSDIEVIHKEVEGKFYHLKYQLTDSEDFLEVATTRPETMFGDMALAVHPSDQRYQRYIGKSVLIPGVNREIPVIADEYVDPEFGSGVVKITPAHDPNDYEVGKRHNLEMPIVMDLSANMTDDCGKYSGLNRFACRELLIKDLTEAGMVIKIEDHVHNVGHSERSGEVVETILSKQWFVKMEELAKQALDFQSSEDKINFYPERFEKTFISWMENIQDWCISRQLWWGHRIPAWYHNQTGEVYVGVNPPANQEEYTQDEDVLDTWFSSALWPMATTIFQDNQELKKFYPTNVLVTGYDIIFFWVSRMIFQAIEFSGEKPFEDVLIHGLIRASDGRKMSKSLGNGIDPMDVIESHGADALRLFLVSNSAPGLDLRYSEEKLDAAWNFLNKVWNVSRFVIQNTNDIDMQEINYDFLDASDYYIMSQFNWMLDKVKYYLDKYEFGEATKYLVNFIRDDFSSWYLEITKSVFSEESEKAINTKIILRDILTKSMIVLHPFCPFISDEIYTYLSGEQIYQASWPDKFANVNEDEIKRFSLIKEIVIAIRNFREQNEISVKKEVDIVIESPENLTSLYPVLKKLANVGTISDGYENQEVVTYVFVDTQVHIINEGLIDLAAKEAKLNDQLTKIKEELARSLKMLSNENFINRAKPEKIQEEIQKAKDNVVQYNKTSDLLNITKKEELVEELEGVISKL